MSRSTRVVAVGATVVALVALGALAGTVLSRHRGGPAQPAGVAASAQPTAATSPDEWSFERADAPARTLVHDRAGRLLATFTDGSRTVTLAAPTRTFSEPQFTRATVTVEVAV